MHITKQEAERLFNSSLLKSLKRHHKEEYQQILQQTPFLHDDALIKQRLWHIKEQIFEPVKCKMCSEHVKWDDVARAGQQKYRTYCSRKCNTIDPDRTAKKLKTEIQRYGRGRKEIVSKIKKTNRERYGSDYAIQTDEIKQKRVETVQKRYGVDNAIQFDQFKQKRAQTNFQRYGNTIPARTKHSKQKTLDTIKQKYNSVTERYKKSGSKTKQTLINQRNEGAERLISNESLNRLNDIKWLQEHNAIFNLNEIATILDVHPSTVSRFLKHHHLTSTIHNHSKEENEIAQLLQTHYYGTILRNDRSVISPKEIDIYLPEINFAIEYDSLYWHSEESGNRNSKYHAQKTQRCEEQNVQLIHVWENEWYLKREVVTSRLLNAVHQIPQKIPARKCKIVVVSKTQQREFFDTTHIQGNQPASVCYGLTYNDELVSAMSFGRSRFSQRYQFELVRFANKLNTTVVGGASRLFKHFIKHHTPQTIVSYSDRRWNRGTVYNQLGFQHSHISAPNYFYFVPGTLTLLSRHQFQKHKQQDKLSIFDQNLSEWENMVNNGYDRIWDCGNDVYVWTI